MASRDEFSRYLLAGAAQIDITPPLEVGILMSSVEGKWAPFEGVRTPLMARALMLEGPSRDQSNDARVRIAIVSLDLLALSARAFGDFGEFKEQISRASQRVISRDELVLTCTHTHSAPESGGLTNLFRGSAFKRWASQLALKIGEVIFQASTAMRPCQAECGTVQVPGLGIHRRIKTTRGVMMSYPAPPEEIVVSRAGANDCSVNIMAFRDPSLQISSMIVNSTCHPVYEMCHPTISADFPGELCGELELTHPGAVALFINGAAGNVNPNGVSSGAAAAKSHATRLAQHVERLLREAVSVQSAYVSSLRRKILIPTRLPLGTDIGESIETELVAIRIGDAAILLVPGEPFSETALAIRAASPFAFTAIAGFANFSIGYIPTEAAYAEGGYEVAFGLWSYLAAGSAEIIEREAIELLTELQLVGASTSGAPAAPHFISRKREKARSGKDSGEVPNAS